MASSSDTPREPNTTEDGATPERPDAPEGGAAPRGRIEEAEILSETPPPGEDTPAAERAPEAAEAQADAAEGEARAEDASDAAGDAAREEDSRDAEDAGAREGQPEMAALAAGAGLAGAAAGATETRPGGTPAAPPPPRGGISVVLGGVIAAALGAGALWFLDNRGVVQLSQTDLSGLESELAAQSARLAETEEALAALDGRAGSIEGAVAALPDSLSDSLSQQFDASMAEQLATALAPVEARLAEFDGRFSALEALPVAQNPEAMELLQGFRADVAAMRSELAETAGRAEALIAAAEDAAARAESAEGELDAIAAEAAAAEAVAAARAAQRQVEAAFANGGPFAAALEAMADAGVAVPAALEPLAETGVPTLNQLRSAFPPAARAALQIANRDVEGQPAAARATAFLRQQFGVRSVAPREGDDADAVLSRAEAAIARGDLDGALAEVSALPDTVRAPLEGWISEVETRRTAVEALAALSAEVESL